MNSQFIEANYLTILLLSNPSALAYTNVFIFNLLFSIFISIAFLYFIPKRFQKSNLYTFLLCTVWNTFIPIAGPITLAIGIFLLHYYAHNYNQAEIVTSIQKKFGTEKFAKLSPYGAGWAYTRIFNESFKKEDRERALYAVNKQRTQQVNDVNRALLDDDTYEIRLYAFNILNKQQTSIANAIKNNLDMIEESTNSTELAQINKSLAYLYWEYALLNLNLNEIVKEMLNTSYTCLMRALEVFPTDGNLWLLLANIYKLLHHDDDYRKTLEVMSGFEFVPVEAYFNAAELCYNDRNYEQIPDYLKHNLYDISSNASLIKFWCRHE